MSIRKKDYSCLTPYSFLSLYISSTAACGGGSTPSGMRMVISSPLDKVYRYSTLLGALLKFSMNFSSYSESCWGINSSLISSTRFTSLFLLARNNPANMIKRITNAAIANKLYIFISLIFYNPIKCGVSQLTEIGRAHV